MITILGPTATGKTTLTAHLAKEVNAEIISADSRQVYRGMDLGTGKDLEDYEIDGFEIPYHLIDIHDPGYEYNVYEFQKDFLRSCEDIKSRSKNAILCGGTGMYLESILKPYDLIKVEKNESLRDEIENLDHKLLIKRLESYGPIHNKTDITDHDRLLRAIEIQDYYKMNPEAERFPFIESKTFGISFDREAIRKRITDRLKKRLESGMLEEVKSLLDKGTTPEQLMFYGLEYKYVTQHVLGEINFNDLFQKLNTSIHQFAKRQMTWFRRMEKNGIPIVWIDGTLPLKDKLSKIIDVIA